MLLLLMSAFHPHRRPLSTHTKLNSAFYPSGVGKSSTGLLGWG